jgi:hypothetical protein
MTPGLHPAAAMTMPGLNLTPAQQVGSRRETEVACAMADLQLHHQHFRQAQKQYHAAAMTICRSLAVTQIGGLPDQALGHAQLHCSSPEANAAVTVYCLVLHEVPQVVPKWYPPGLHLRTP